MVGSLRVAFACLVTAWVGGAVLAVLAAPTGAGRSDVLTLASVMAAGSLGAASRAVATESGPHAVTGSVSVELVPATLTLLALGAAALGFVRTVPPRTGPWSAAGTAGGSAALVGASLWAQTTLVSTGDADLGGWGSVAAATLGVAGRIEVPPERAGLAAAGLVLSLLGVLVLVRHTRWAGVLGVPACGVAVLVLLLPVAGAVGGLATQVGAGGSGPSPSGEELRLLASGALALLANAGLVVLALGAGSRAGFRVEASDGAASGRIAGLGGPEGLASSAPGLWVAPVVLALVLGCAALLVVRRSPGREAAAVATWVAMTAVLLPLVLRLVSVEVSGSGLRAGVPLGARLVAGPDLVLSWLLLTLAAAVVGALALLTSSRPPWRAGGSG